MKIRSMFRRPRARLIMAGAVAALGLGIAIPMTALAAPKACDLQCVIAFGNQQIGARQTALTALNNKVTTALNNHHITSDQANVLESDVSTNRSGLTALQQKLDGETTLAAARNDVKNMYLQFRIYAVVLPRDYRELWLDELINVDAKLKGLEPKIEQAVDSAPSGEQAQLKALFDDYKSQVAAAESQDDAALTEIPQLTPENFNNDRSAYETALDNLKNDEKTAHTDLHQAASDLRQIVQILKSNHAQATTATPTA
jgi:hypothetical protein